MTKRKRLLIIGALALAIIIAAIFKLIIFINTPDSGKVSQTNSSADTQNTFNITPKSLTDSLVRFNYPAALSIAANSKLVPPVVAMYNLSYRDIETWNLAISIVKIPSGSLNDNNAYQFRKINPQTYTESRQTINGQVVDIMTDKTVGGFSKVAFLVHNQYQANVSLYGDDPAGVSNLQTTFNMILSSWQWRAS